MSSKQIFITIVGATILTISHIKFLALFASEFGVRGDEIIFNLDTIEMRIHAMIYVIMSFAVWKLILPKTPLLNILLTGCCYFPFFMLLVMGWFASDFSTHSFSETLSMLTGYMLIVILVFVSIGISNLHATEPEKAKKNDS